MGSHSMAHFCIRTSSAPPLLPTFPPVLSSCLHISRVAFSAATSEEKNGRTPASSSNKIRHECGPSHNKVEGFLENDFKLIEFVKADPICSDIRFGKGCNCLKNADVLKKRWHSHMLVAGLINFPAVMSFNSYAHAVNEIDGLNVIYGDLGAGLEIGIQFLYLATLLGLVGVGTFFVVRQLLVRRELESAAKELQDRVRTGEASSVEYFELGAIMLRKKFFVLASKYLQQAIEKWDGDPQDLAQVHNALGFSLFNDGKIDKGIAEYEKAVKLQPGYVVAWNNLGNAYEKKKNLPKALEAYEQALSFDPNNSVAKEYGDAIRKKLDRLAGIPVKYD